MAYNVLRLIHSELSVAGVTFTVEMQENVRRESRRLHKQTYSITWQDQRGLSQSARAHGENISDSGIGVRCFVEIPIDTAVYIQADDGHREGYAIVRRLTSENGAYTMGLEWDEPSTISSSSQINSCLEDHYEFLQISPKAQAETIQRVYRFLATRYHPDNPETGDADKFMRLNQAYGVLSDPKGRSEYDASLKAKSGKPSSLFESIDFLDGVEGEVNRRLAVLALLYRKCRANVHNPQISLLELEAMMGFPREYLDFTMWYLRSKKYVRQEDNAEFALTCSGIDYVEENYSKLPVLRKLLTEGKPLSASSSAPHHVHKNGSGGVHFLPAASIVENNFQE